MQVIRARDCPPVAWKNGGGTTQEIAVFPPGADMDSFLWRLSMARVEVAGAFSTFAGIDRTLAVLDGKLVLDGGNWRAELTPGSAPLPFAGDQPVTGRPVGGSVLDLNAMARRGHYAIAMDRLAKGDTAQAGAFVIALEPQRLGDAALGRHDCVQLDGPESVTGPVIVVRFRPI